MGLGHKQAVDAERFLSEILSPLARRDMPELRARVCVGPPEQCAELLSRYGLRVVSWSISGRWVTSAVGSR
jgi:hypothetical protein